MQRPPELVPIPESLRMASEGFGKLRKVAAFWKNPENQVVAKLARGEELTEYQAAGMRIQRSRPAAWNMFLVAVIG